MPRRLIKRYLPDSHEVRSHPWISRFGHRLHDPNLWHLNRRSFSGGVAVGLFCALLPFPGQMLVAAALAIALRVNLPTAVVLVWMTNPLTIPPVFFGAYLFGCLLLGRVPVTQNLSEWQTILTQLDAVWMPLFVGSLVLGGVLALAGFVGVRLLWRWYVIRKRERRHHRQGSLSQAGAETAAPDRGLSLNQTPPARVKETPGSPPEPAARTASHR